MGKAVFLTDVIRAIFERRGKRVVGRKYGFLTEPLHKDRNELTLPTFPAFEKEGMETGWMAHDIETGESWILDEYIEYYANLSREEYEEFDEARYQELMRDARVGISVYLPFEEDQDGNIKRNELLLPLATLVWERVLQAEPGEQNYSLAAKLAAEILEKKEFPRWAFKHGTRRARKELALHFLEEAKREDERLRALWGEDNDNEKEEQPSA